MEKWVNRLAHGDVLDVGTGTGILAFAATKKSNRVLGIDIDEESIRYAKSKNKFKNVEFKKSDLFSNVDGKFDLIIFNPPYLPPSKYDKGIDTTDNGTIEKFLREAKNFLKKDGKILLCFSSLTKIKFDKNYSWKKLDERNVGFEKIYVYKLKVLND